MKLIWRGRESSREKPKYVNDPNLTTDQKDFLEKANCQDDGTAVYIIDGKIVVNRM